jgi:hypothetical protein
MESSLRTVEALQKRLDRMAAFCDVCPRETDSYRELQDFLGGSLENSPVLVALEHARVLEQPIRDACKRIERGVEALEAEARCISMAWLCLQALAMQATGADLDFYWPRPNVGISGGPDALLRLHLRSVDGGVKVQGDGAAALGAEAGVHGTKRGRGVVFTDSDFVKVMTRVFRNTPGDDELYCFRLGKTCLVEVGAGGAPTLRSGRERKRGRS